MRLLQELRACCGTLVRGGGSTLSREQRHVLPYRNRRRRTDRIEKHGKCNSSQTIHNGYPVSLSVLRTTLVEREQAATTLPRDRKSRNSPSPLERRKKKKRSLYSNQEQITVVIVYRADVFVSSAAKQQGRQEGKSKSLNPVVHGRKLK